MTDIVERLTEAFHPDDDDGLPTDATVADVRDARDEIERLRALITEWVDAYADAQWNPIAAAHHRLHAADAALREEANR